MGLAGCANTGNYDGNVITTHDLLQNYYKNIEEGVYKA